MTRSWRRQDDVVGSGDQQALKAWKAYADEVRALQEAKAASREARMDIERRLAVVERVEQALATSAPPGGGRKAVLAHRHDWWRGALRSGLQERGVEVVADTPDGAEALGAAIAAQPALVVVEDRLPGFVVVELVELLRRCTAAVVAVQVEATAPQELIAVGAHAVIDRRVPPAKAAEELSVWLARDAAEPLLLT